MLVMRVPVVVPTKVEWLILLLTIGFMGFVAQVCTRLLSMNIIDLTSLAAVPPDGWPATRNRRSWDHGDVCAGSYCDAYQVLSPDL